MPSQYPIPKCHGYTLVELMVTTALLAVLLQLGVPAMTQWLKEWQRDLATRSFTHHLTLARVEAIKNAQRVVMCTSSNGQQCSGTAEREWKNGWLVFQDLDGNGARDPSEPLIANEQALEGITSLLANNRIQRFVFLPTGMMASGMCTLEVIPGAGKIQRITVNRVGRIRLSMGEPDMS